TGPVVDRTVDGPVPDLVETGEAVDRRWSAVGRAAAAPRALWGRSHTVRAGIDVGAARQQRAAAFSGAIGELVDGHEARVWNYSNPGVDAIRHETTVSAFAADRVDLLPRVVLDAAIRYDGVSGAASGALRGISWQTWLPRV